MKRILIVGATSAIAAATARDFAARGDTLFLVARNANQLRALADDLRVRGATIAGTAPMDALDLAGLSGIVDNAIHSLGGLEAVLIAHGTLSDQQQCSTSVALLEQEFGVNALSVMALSLRAAYHFSREGRGVLAVISSVAGDRGRQSNFIYGSAKAAVSAFLSGLGQQLHKRGVAVVTVKPGFVSTPMTAGFKQGALWASPARVARDIVRAMDRGKPVLYTPWFWRPIMFVIRSVPETIFRRLKL
jgi:decaprenylphospho-beta-D-erythro-pentofuranosid-2-ulose 2-reductase